MPDDFVMVGTKEGHLLIYKITFTPAKAGPEIAIALSNKNFTVAIGTGGTRKPIIQIGIIPEHKVLIALTTDGVSTHDMDSHNCKCINLIERTKGASSFALDIQRQTSLTGDPCLTVRMCVVVGKCLQLYYWKNRCFKELREDFSVPDIPKSISWCKETICLGFRNEYCTLDVVILTEYKLQLLTGKQREVCSRSKSTDPMIVNVSLDTFAVVNEKQCFLIQTESEDPTKVEDRESNSKKSAHLAVTWTDAPVSLGKCLPYDEPYFIGILPGKGIEVRTIRPKLKIDSFPINQAKLAFRTKSGRVFISSSNSIWCLKSTPIDTQMDLFVKQKHFELALGLSNIWEESATLKNKKISQIKNLFAFHLFCHKKFNPAMHHFSELGTDASHVIGLFPDLLPQEYRNGIYYPSPVPEFRGLDLENGLSALVRTALMGSSNQTVTDAASIVEGGHTLKSKRELLQIIDTTLLKCYLQTNESLVASLLRLKDNHCHVEETERALKKHRKYNDLIILYQTKGNHRKALETLQKQNNTERIIQYLQHLGREQMDLILEFAKPVLEVDANEGLRIFTDDLHEVEQLSRPRVYDFLLKNFPSLVIPYLEHVVHTLEETNALFHNALIHQYREKAVSQEESPETRKNMRQKLSNLLQKSDYFTPEIVLVHFPYDDMYEERALIFRKLGRHEPVLSIYIGALRDINMALEYCRTTYDKNDPSKKDVFTILLKMLLSPSTTILPGFAKESEEPLQMDKVAILRLLKEYAPYLDPIRVLSVLPDDFDMCDMETFLKTSIQNQLAERRKLLIKKGLVEAEHLKAKHDKVYVESEGFTIDDYTMCAKENCNKRLTSQSAFIRNSDGTIVHYYCQQKE
ncbi:Vam6/Vps39-like protein [Orchesella cincta]|uniref:Vam6/Vps39-like protein n=1 Tax=Orchesella cincta TaxID=48709 RepID=A0A1D2MK76_ORCCI|nr:Vam6/Vps39-like protein [Orchesella cincta]